MPRFGHSLNAVRDTLLLFGGRSTTSAPGLPVQVTNDVHLLSGLGALTGSPPTNNPDQSRGVGGNVVVDLTDSEPRAYPGLNLSLSGSGSLSMASGSLSVGGGRVTLDGRRLPPCVRWERLAPRGPLPTPRAFHATVTLGATLLIVGGEKGSELVGEEDEVRYTSTSSHLHVIPPILASPLLASPLLA